MKRRLRAAACAALACSVVLLVGAASAVDALLDAARPLRWVVLGGLACAAVAWAAAARGFRARPSALEWVAAALVALALLSTAWSVDPTATFLRSGSVALVLVAAAALARAARVPADADAVLATLFGAIVAVSFAGVVLAFVAPAEAVIPAEGASPALYRGLGGNPHTVAMLASLGIPLGLAFSTRLRRPLARAGSFVAVAVMTGTIVLADSRTSLIAAFGGTLVLIALARVPRIARAALAAALLATFAGLSAAIPRLEPPSPEAEPPRTTRIDPARAAARASCVELPPDEVGAPPCGVAPPLARRPLFSGGGRLDAWEGALRQARERPLLGYGFGTERQVFLDRYYPFESELPENSYIGAALQLGGVGVAVLVLLLLLAFAGAVQRAAVLELALVVAGVTLALTQSYLYVAGSPAMLPFWIAAFVGARTRSGIA